MFNNTSHRVAAARHGGAGCAVGANLAGALVRNGGLHSRTRSVLRDALLQSMRYGRETAVMGLQAIDVMSGCMGTLIAW